MKPAFDSQRRELLLRMCRERVASGADGDQVLVSVQDFFLGNADPASIGCNLTEHPGIETFAAVLATVRERPDVQDVFVEITDRNDAVSDSWPFSDRVYVVSGAALGQVEKWLLPLSPDDVLEVTGHEAATQRLPHVRSGYKVYLAWWD